jgi:hypothetical protein
MNVGEYTALVGMRKPKEGAQHDGQSAAGAAASGSASPVAAEYYRDRKQGALTKLHCSTAARQVVRKLQ